MCCHGEELGNNSAGNEFISSTPNPITFYYEQLLNFMEGSCATATDSKQTQLIFMEKHLPLQYLLCSLSPCEKEKSGWFCIFDLIYLQIWSLTLFFTVYFSK